MTNIIKHCWGEKKRGIISTEGFRKKLMIPDNEICVSRTWSKIKNRDYICKQRYTRRILCQDLWNRSLFLWAL